MGHAIMAVNMISTVGYKLDGTIGNVAAAFFYLSIPISLTCIIISS